MFIVLGIGNPDEKYADTRHNVGWMTVDALSETIGKKFRKAGFEFWAAEGRLGRHDVVLVKTWTYVNETGRAIPEIRKRWGDGRRRAPLLDGRRNQEGDDEVQPEAPFRRGRGAGEGKVVRRACGWPQCLLTTSRRNGSVKTYEALLLVEPTVAAKEWPRVG